MSCSFSNKPQIDALLADCVGFWLQHSLDAVHGGYFNCLDRDGAVFATTKHVWLQGRQVWMLSRLYNEHPAYHTDEVLGAAKLGVDFLRTHAKRDDGRVYFALAQDGTPQKLQRKVFAECFYIMALSEYARAVKGTASAAAATLFQEACELFEKVQRWSADLSLVGDVLLADDGVRAHSLAIPMITLNVICELRKYNNDATLYAVRAAACIPEIKMHVDPARKMVHELVGPNGEFLDSPEGRLLNPGHAIEAGWFVLNYANEYGQRDPALIELGLSMIRWSLDFGWDADFGGIFYFLDASGRHPTQLEWDQKLWWVHCEAMVATLLAFEVTGDAAWLQDYERVCAYTLAHFPDTPANALTVPVAPGGASGAPGGEWFGYLHRDGTVSQRFKGGPYKGCFHVPRALFLCSTMLARHSA